MISTDQFIDLLERQKLIKANVAQQLRAKAQQGDSRITPKSILKYLVKKELVTRAQAKELLETTLTVSEKAESSILGISPLVPEALSQSALSEPDPLPPPVKSPERPAGEAPLFSADLYGSDEDEPMMLLPVADEHASEVLDAESKKASRPTAGSKLRPSSPRKSKGKKPAPKKKPGKEGKGQWDSPLILGGGGILAVLVLGSVVLYYLLFRETADKALAEADGAFKQGNYAQAAELYQKFVTDYPHDKEVSEARVRINMSKLWDRAESGDFPGAADAAPELISGVENEPAFISDAEQTSVVTKAKQDLSMLLPRIAKGLADKTAADEDDARVAKLLEQADVVLALAANSKYIPDELRKPSEIAAIQETLAQAKARVQRKTDLADSLKRMEEVTAAGKPAEALKIRDELLLAHSSLAEDPQLLEAVAKVGAAEQASVKYVEASETAATAPAESPIVAELALADRRGAAAAGAATPVVVRIDGGLYGLNSGDGALLWRRYVGAEAASYPLLLPTGMVVAADAQRGELVAVEAPSGKLVWRLPLSGKLATPVTLENRLLVASDAGKLYIVDAATGKLTGYVQFSQPIRQPPVVNERGDRVYVLGEHSNLYTISTQNFSCVGVYYLGHAAGGAATPPVAILNKVIVADNSGAETCQIRVLALNDQGAPMADAVRYRLSGLVTSPLQTAGRRFATVTSQGQAIVFEVAASNDKAALTALASRDAQNSEPMARFGLLHDGHLWLAASELTKLEVLPTGNQLPVRSIERDYRGDAFDYPLQSVGNLIIHVRRPRGQGGATVSAMDVAANKALWETSIAVPPAGPPAVDASSQQIVAGSSSGAVFVLTREAMARRVQDQALHADAASLKPSLFDDSVDLGGGRVALAGAGSDNVIHFRPNDPRQQLRAITLPGPLSGALAAWGDAFAASSKVGQIYLYGADDAAEIGTPFQPELTPGKEYAWLPPVAVGAGADAGLAVSDGVAKVYLLRRVAEPEPHLEAAAMVDVGPSPLTTRLAAVGETVFAGNEAGKLARFAAPELAPGEATDLGGRVTWGPYPAADSVLVTTDADELLCIGVDGAVRWRQPLAHGIVLGEPLVAEGHVFLLHSLGVVKRSLADGVEADYVDVGQTLVAGPVPFAGRLIVTAADGTLLVINQP